MGSLRLDLSAWRRVGEAAGVVIVLFLVAQVWLQHLALKRDQVIYRNPLVVRQVRTVRVEGPVRVVVKTIREPSGREEVIREETRGAVVEAAVNESLSRPVFPPQARAGGWLAGASAHPFRLGDRSGWTGWAGYSIGGRLNLCAGVTGEGRPAALALWRF